ncbi:Striatin-3 [Oryzias melastigma]|uniref:Striatin-3 n=1 Tax=Oryzias melastigma TaxID=30732 RepID=A0A834CCJ0_ORYME|nr:Striatin-3 [Oryzias melastigma]
MVASFNGGDVAIYDLETSQTAVVLKGQGDGTAASLNHINKVVSHPTLPITITAHEDRHIKFFDNKTGKLIHAMVAHLDAVTSLAVDPKRHLSDLRQSRLLAASVEPGQQNLRPGDHRPPEEERGGHLRRHLPPLQGLHRLRWRRRPRQGLRVKGEESRKTETGDLRPDSGS